MRMYAFLLLKHSFHPKKATIKMHRNTQVRRTWLTELILNLIYFSNDSGRTRNDRQVQHIERLCFCPFFVSFRSKRLILFAVSLTTNWSLFYVWQRFLKSPNRVLLWDSFENDDADLNKANQKFQNVYSLKMNFTRDSFVSLVFCQIVRTDPAC